MDAACCMPIFIIAICTLLFLIAQAGMEETLQYTMIQSARCSVKAYAVPQSSDVRVLAGSAAFKVQWESMLYAEWGGEQPGASITKLSFNNETVLPGSDVSIDNIVHACGMLKTVIPFPKAPVQSPVIKKNITFRPFVGESVQNVPFDNTRVYVFPKSGERYHSLSCSILQGGTMEAFLTSGFRKAKEPCKICNPQNLPDGSKVYMFTSDSRIYHRQACPTITKSYVCISRGEAISQGYTPCLLCGGGEN